MLSENTYQCSLIKCKGKTSWDKCCPWKKEIIKSNSRFLHTAMALTHLLNYALLFFQKFLLFGERALYDVCMAFTYFFSLCGPFPKRWGRNICFLNTRCPSLGWKDRMGPCSSLPQRLEALLSKTFWCLALYLRGPEGDMRCSTGSWPEQCVPRIANTSRGG